LKKTCFLTWGVWRGFLSRGKVLEKSRTLFFQDPDPPSIRGSRNSVSEIVVYLNQFNSVL